MAGEGDPPIVEEKSREVEIRWAREDDIDDLLTVERSCFNVYYYAFYMLERRDFEHYLGDPDHLFLVAILGGRLVGYVLGPVEGWRTPPSAHIDSIAVLPDVQQEGIGGRLLQEFVQRVKQHGCEVVTLEVSPANEAGMTFFGRRGFQKVRGLRDYYGKGLHGLLMAASCGSGPSNE